MTEKPVPEQAMFELVESIVRNALFCFDADEAQYIDWDLVEKAYALLVGMARQGGSDV